MELGEQTTGALLIAAILIGLVALALAVAALVGQRRVRRAYARFSLGRDEDVLESLQRHIDGVAALRSEVSRVSAHADQLRALLRGTLSRFGAVRYDAFEDMGGRLSFSAALLDEDGDGLVITSINGRTETRTYAKPLVAGRSQHNLSDEEVTAIEQAMARAGRSGARTPDKGPGARRGRVPDRS